MINSKFSSSAVGSVTNVCCLFSSVTDASGLSLVDSGGIFVYFARVGAFSSGSVSLTFSIRTETKRTNGKKLMLNCFKNSIVFENYTLLILSLSLQKFNILKVNFCRKKNLHL